nr:MAG TPA: hypothetical protein [Caudoviricetes sp.]
MSIEKPQCWESSPFFFLKLFLPCCSIVHGCTFLFVNFAHFCALVCKIGFLFFNFPCFCTIDHEKMVAIGEYGVVF